MSGQFQNMQLQGNPAMQSQLSTMNAIDKLGHQKLGALFASIGALFLNRISRAFKMMDFVSTIRSVLPVLITNDDARSSSPRQLMTNAAGTAYASATWNHFCPPDRFRVILAAGLSIDGSAGGATAGNQAIALGNSNQIRSLSQVNIKRRAQISTEQFPWLGPVDWRDSAGGSAAAVPAAIAMNTLWEILCPWGPSAQMDQALAFDVLQPNENVSITVAGASWVGVTTQTTQAIEGTLLGVGFDIMTG